ARRRTGAQPGEGGGVIRVEAELAAARGVGDALLLRPGVLATRIEARAREVEAVGTTVGVEHLRLEAGEQAQRLGVAFEAADIGRPVVERALAVMAVGRMPEVVREARRVVDVGVEAEVRGELATDLGDLEPVGEAVSGEVEAGGRAQHLGLDGEPAKRTRMQDAGPVAREIAASR